MAVTDICRPRRLDEGNDSVTFQDSQRINGSDMSAIGRVVHVQWMIELGSQGLQASARGCGGTGWERAENLRGELQNTVIPDQDRGNLKNIAKDILARRRLTRGDVSGIRQADREIRMKRLDRCDRVTD